VLILKGSAIDRTGGKVSMKILISLMGNAVVASETADTHTSQVMEMVYGEVNHHLSKIVSEPELGGDVRDSFRIRTVQVNLKR